MDFGVLPPEVNSARLYAGPGSAPMLAVAAVWSRLAAELGAAGRAYEAVISRLADEEWSGPASESMAAAAAPYAAWMAATAGQAEQTAARAAAAASAFEEARAAVVPPPVIAANRARLAALVATNVLGQNAAAIAAAEAQYLQMWAQDVVAMYGYAARSAAAAAVTPFADPPATTNPAGQAGQAAVVAQAGAAGTHSQLSQLISAIPQALQTLASAPAAPAPTPPSFSDVVSWTELIAKSIVPFNDAIKTILYGMVQFSRNLMIDLDIAAATKAAAAAATATSATGALMPTGVVVGGAGSAISAGIGNAVTVGKLAVPAAWAESAPAVKMAVAALPGTGAGAAAAAAAPGGLFADMALASLLGRSIAGNGPRSRPGPAAMMNGHARGRLEKLVTELAGTHDVQHWHVDASRLDSFLEELSEQPGVHAVHVNPDGREERKPGPQPSG